jgi:protein-tyrosine-phosphatase
VPERGDHVSRIVTRELLDRADLILALGASHSSSLAVTSPKARAVTFRLAVASRLASLIASPGHALTGATVGLPRIDQLDPLSRVPKLPQSAPDRFEWLVAEMNAWRGSLSESESDSVIDPHDAEDDQHPPVAIEITELVAAFAGAVKAVVQA